MTATEWTEHKPDAPCPISNEEQRVEVRWRHFGGTTKYRAGALNWDEVKEYRFLSNPLVEGGV